MISNFRKNNRRNTEIENLRKLIITLNQVLNALGEFKGHYEKRFNFSRLAEYLQIPKSEINNVISLILNFQEMFEEVFKNYRLQKKIINSQRYLVTEKKITEQKEQEEKKNTSPKKIRINKDQSKLLSDIVYLFKRVKRGKGFDLENVDSELLRNLKKLKDQHPYLFNKNGNNLTYPSEIGLELGSLILSYNKSNKKIENFNIKNYQFEFD
ncbi:MAG: hypothetical protein ACFFAN_04225 [Promethearchaeota archaeon]